MSQSEKESQPGAAMDLVKIAGLFAGCIAGAALLMKVIGIVIGGI